MFTAELDGLDELKEDIRAAELTMGRGVTRAVQMACEEGASEARERHAYKSRTGNLESKTTGYLTVSGPDFAKGEIVADTDYASYVDEGTAPHIIRPPKGGLLAWENPDAQGDWHYSRKPVRHPGTKPYGFMGQAYFKAEAVLTRELEITMDDVVKIFAR